MGPPVVAAGVVAALLAGGAVVGTLTGGSAGAEALTLAVDGPTTSAITEEVATKRADGVRVAADRAASNTQKSALTARAVAVQKAKAAALAKQRAADAAKATRAAARKNLVAKAQADPRSAARLMLPQFGFDAGQWSCLSQLWAGESNWNHRAANSSSGAYGIPQALPGKKMATMGSDWRTNPVTQIRWGLDYIKTVYGTPCNALGFWNGKSPHWY